MNRTFLPLLAVLLAAACSQISRDPLGPDALLSPDSTGAAVITDDLGVWPTDRLEFHEVRIAQDTLIATVSFSGGCREHRFALAFANVFMESHPVQVQGIIAHDADGDLCRALLGRTLRFDLTPLKRAYQANYRRASDTIILHGNWPGPLRYEF
jgi:hypothetical protein